MMRGVLARSGNLFGALAAAAAVLAVAALGCKAKKRELGLSRARGDAAPVVVVDRVVEGGVTGPLSAEVEPNDQRDQAAAVAVPGGIEGALASDGDVDFFVIEPGPARPVLVKLVGPGAGEGGVDLVLSLHDGDGKPIAKSDRGPAGTVEGLSGAPLAAGARHYLSVSQFVKKGKKKPKKGAAVADPPATPGSYRLTVELLAPGPGEELEPNDDAGAAREVLLSDEVSGHIGWSKDVDHWKLSLAGFSGGYVLDLAVDGVEGVDLVVDLLAPDGRSIASRKGARGRGVLVRGFLPEVGARHWLARVSGARSNPEEAYRLRTIARELEQGYEAEPNDDEKQAIVVGPLGEGEDGERRGYLDAGDVDVYRFEGAREPLTLSVSLVPPSGVDLVVRVLRPGGKEVAKADGGKAGVTEVLDAIRLPGGEALLVAVSGTSVGDEVDPYVLRWASRVDLGAPMRDPHREPDPSDGDLDPGSPYDD
jgi:hypothetical protein